jgi:hypothetical protein
MSHPVIGTHGSAQNASTNYTPSKLKTYGFAIAIIVGLCGIGIAITGVAGFFHIGSLNNLAQVDAMIMMAAGGGGGIVFLVIGLVGTLKNRQAGSPLQAGGDNAAPDNKPTVKNGEKVSFIDTQGGLVYGKDTWQTLNIEVLDDVVPNAPSFDWDAKDPYFNQAYSENYILLYIPQKVSVNGITKEFNLQTLKDVSSDLFLHCDDWVAQDFGNSVITFGWRLISKRIIPQNQQGDFFKTTKNLGDGGNDFRLLHALEAIALNQMLYFAPTHGRLYGSKATYIGCSEKIDGQGNNDRVVIGCFGHRGFGVYRFGNLRMTRGEYGFAVGISL